MNPSDITHSSQRLTLLYRISQVFNSSLNLREVLERVIDEIIRIMNAERGFIMLYNPQDELEFQAARGMDRLTIDKPDFQVSKSIIRRVEQDKIPLLTNNAQKEDDFGQQRSIVLLKLRSVLCVPMLLKERVLGIIYIDNSMQTGAFSEHDRDLLVAIAANAAVAIENARLYEEIRDAYDTTLEGWAHALELRDKETEGHSARVVELSLLLGREMGLSEEDLLHLKRGALLHDMGKMAIPDRILLKTGPLNPDEWDEMHRHPELAYQFLNNIAYLRKALDVPYCHHEKWDGTGYPRGLKASEIPLLARIFSVVDVWDAITSDRPYRAGMSKEEAIEHLYLQAGRHFDPLVVEAFINVVKGLP